MPPMFAIVLLLLGFFIQFAGVILLLTGHLAGPVHLMWVVLAGGGLLLAGFLLAYFKRKR